MVKEMRRFPRVGLQVIVSYWVADQERSEPYQVESLDISEGGIFLRTDMPLGIGTAVSLQCLLPDQDRPISIEGKVVWERGRDQEDGRLVAGKGIRFFSISKSDRMVLREFVASRL